MPNYNARFVQVRTVETTLEAPSLAEAEKLAQAAAKDGPRVLVQWKRLETLDNKLTFLEVEEAK